MKPLNYDFLKTFLGSAIEASEKYYDLTKGFYQAQTDNMQKIVLNGINEIFGWTKSFSSMIDEIVKGGLENLKNWTDLRKAE